jgi:hypothetical protein
LSEHGINNFLRGSIDGPIIAGTENLKLITKEFRCSENYAIRMAFDAFCRVNGFRRMNNGGSSNGDEFVNETAQIALSEVERNLVQATRDFEDAARDGDRYLGADAYRRYMENKTTFDKMTDGDQPQQQQQQQPGLSVAQRNYLSRRAYGGDQLTPQRMGDYAKGHERAVAAGFRSQVVRIAGIGLLIDATEYFSCVSNYVDHLGGSNEVAITEIEVQQREESPRWPITIIIPKKIHMGLMANIVSARTRENPNLTSRVKRPKRTSIDGLSIAARTRTTLNSRSNHGEPSQEVIT